MQIKTKGQYLEFSDTTAFFNRLNEVNSLNDSALNIWDENMGFLSMRQIHFSYDTFMQSMPDTVYYNQYVNHPNYQTYQNYTAKYQSAFWMDPRDSSYWYNVFDPRMASVVNHKGIVMIGKVFFQFTRDYVKVMLDSSECKLPMLMSATADDTLNKIYVRPVEINLTSSPADRKSPESRQCMAEHGFVKVVGRIDLGYSKFPIIENWTMIVNHDFANPVPIKVFLGWKEKTTLSIYARSERKSLFRSEWRLRTAIKIRLKAEWKYLNPRNHQESPPLKFNDTRYNVINFHHVLYDDEFVDIIFCNSRHLAELRRWHDSPRITVECFNSL